MSLPFAGKGTSSLSFLFSVFEVVGFQNQAVELPARKPHLHLVS